MGHSVHLNSIDVVENDEFYTCGEYIEMMYHCPAFVDLRFEYIGNDAIPDITQVKEVCTKSRDPMQNKVTFLMVSAQHAYMMT